MSGCSCVYVDCDDSNPDVMTEEIRQARRQHKCGECGRVISPGESYEHIRGLWEGKWSTNKTCADCMSIRKAFFCGSFLHGMILQDLREHIDELDGELSGDCITPLTERAKDVVCKMIQDVYDERNVKEPVNA